MNFYLDFELSDSWNEWSHDWNKSIDEGDLRYSLVLGNIYIGSEGANFNAEWGWIPLLDFIACLKDISKELKSGKGKECFEFTESDHHLKFARIHNQIYITASYAQGIVSVESDNFNVSITNFVQKLVKEIEKKQPVLLKNPHFRNLIQDLR